MGPWEVHIQSTTTSAGAVVVPSVSWLTAFQLQASKALNVLYTTTEDAGLSSPPPTHTHNFCLSFGHLNRTQTFTYHSHSYIPGLIIMFPHSECFCPIERAECWTTSPPPPISQVVRLNAFASLHSLCQYSPTLLHSEYFCQCHFFFFFLPCVFRSLFSARKKKNLVCAAVIVLYNTLVTSLYILGSSHLGILC